MGCCDYYSVLNFDTLAWSWNMEAPESPVTASAWLRLRGIPGVFSPGIRAAIHRPCVCVRVQLIFINARSGAQGGLTSAWGARMKEFRGEQKWLGRGARVTSEQDYGIAHGHLGMRVPHRLGVSFLLWIYRTEQQRVHGKSNRQKSTPKRGAISTLRKTGYFSETKRRKNLKKFLDTCIEPERVPWKFGNLWLSRLREIIW